MEMMMKHNIFFVTAVSATVLSGTLGLSPSQALSQEVNIYTAREPKLIQPVLEAFTRDTGIKTNVVFAQNGLEERIRAEGTNSPADLILTVDVSKLVEAAEMGITQKIESSNLNSAIPAAYRDSAGQWFASTLRARVIYASKDRVKDEAVTYEDLANPRWKGKICIRDGQNTYNTSLFSAVVAHMGPAKAEEWLKGFKANLAKKPSGGDRDVAKDIASGQCDIGLANTYYLGLMLNKEPERLPWAQAVKVIYPNFVGGGTHINISGFALAKHAPNKANAVRLAEWLVSDKAQDLYARQNYEHPIRDGIALDPTVASFGVMKPDTISLTEIAKNRKVASELVDKVQFNAGPGI
jgi:iron(III) transport system substrate-binding protein